MSLLRAIFRIVFWLLALLGLATLAASIAVFVFVLGFEKPPAAIEDKTILTLDLGEGLPESAGEDWWEPWRRPLTLPQAVLALNAAAKDPRIDGLMLRIGEGSGLDMARTQELRAAFKALRAGGKTINAFSESFGEAGNGTTAYYLAAAADKIFLQPSGEVGLLGFRLEVPFLKGALDSLGIEARASQRREYKSAPYSFTRTSMPEPVRQNLQRLADSWLEQVVADISADRKIDPATVRQWVDGAPWGAQDAAKRGLVDALAYWSEAEISLGEKDRMVALSDYWTASPDTPANAPKFALVSALGPIVLGAGRQGPFGEENVIASAAMSDAIAAAVKDKVKAIVVRIDSPGGSYVAADQIWREIDKAKSSGIPVIVSMIGTAASGGYFIAAPATKIVAEPGTITGSIGVFGGKPVLSGLWAKLGISVEGVQAGAAAGADSVNVDFTPETWARLEARMDAIYADFVSKVATGRGLSPSVAELAAKGQIWSGADAKEKGLVDELGGFAVALGLAREAAKIAPDAEVRLVSYPTPQTPIEKFMSLIESRADAPQASALAVVFEMLFGRDGARLASAATGAEFAPLWLPPIIVNGANR